MPEETNYPRIQPASLRVVRGIFTLIYRIAMRVHISGLEHVPDHGPLIVVSNHLSFVDTPLIGIAFPGVAHPLAAEKYEHHPFSPILRSAGAIFINRGEVDRHALRQAIDVLRAGENLAIAIEGTRSPTGGLNEGKTGVAYIATRAEAPLLPIVVYGTEKVIPNLLRLRRTDVYAVFGPLIHLPKGRARSDQLTTYTDQIMVALAALLPEEYRGVYANHPLLMEHLSATHSAS